MLLRFSDLCFICIIINLFQENSSEKSNGLEIVPERAEIDYFNPKYLSDVVYKVRKLSRRGPYIVNLSATLLHTWTNNVSLNVVMFEYLHNDYKRTFVEFHYRMCDFINNDLFIGSLMKKYGIVCPLSQGFQAISNGSMTFPRFPYVFPFTRAKAEIIFKRMEPTEEVIAIIHLYVKIKQTTKK